MSAEAIDDISLSKTVMFVGDYFTLMTTVVLDEKLRLPEEDDEQFAIRLAQVWMQEYYGWDLEKVSNEIGLVED